MAVLADPNLLKQVAVLTGPWVWAVLCEVGHALETAKGLNDEGLEMEWMHTGGAAGLEYAGNMDVYSCVSITPRIAQNLNIATKNW